MDNAKRSTEKKIAPLARETNAALRQIIQTVGQINDVYIEETDALIAVDSPKFFSLQDKKYDRAVIYHAHMHEMLGRKDEIKSADPLLRKKLKEMQEAFHTLTQRNLEALDRMQRCTDKLAQTIRSAAVRTAQSQRNLSYGGDGTINNYSRNKVISSGLSETA